MISKLRKGLVASVVCTAAFAGGHSAAAEALTAQFAFSIVEVDAAGEELLVERETVKPGETIEYAIVHENVSEDNLTNLVLGGAVPEGVVFVPGSAKTSVEAVMEVQAELEPEVEGLEWSTWPAERKIIEADGTERMEPLPADAVRALRWTLADALASGGTAENSYRVVVN